MTGEVPVFYATTEGQTRRIAERLAGRLRQRGIDSRAVDVARLDDDSIDWSRIRAAALGASLHAGRHQTEATAFAKTHAAHLSVIPSVFFSVSLSAASSRADEVASARRIADAFPPASGWTTVAIRTFAGRLAYTKYGFLKRFMMKRIARKEGAPTDTSRDYELTNWEAVDRLGDEIAGRLGAGGAQERPAAVA